MKIRENCYSLIWLILNVLIHWIVIYLVDSAIQLLNNWGLISATIVKKVLFMLKITLNTVMRYSHCKLSWRLRWIVTTLSFLLLSSFSALFVWLLPQSKWDGIIPPWPWTWNQPQKCPTWFGTTLHLDFGEGTVVYSLEEIHEASNFKYILKMFLKHSPKEKY